MSNQKPEQKVQNKIIAYLKELRNNGAPIYYEKRQAGGLTYKVGLPDLYIVYAGTHIEVEIKSSTGTRSSEQLKWEQIFKTIGVPYACVNSYDEFMEFFYGILRSAGEIK